MSAPTHTDRTPQPLEVELLVKEDARRERVTVATQEAFRTSITPPAPEPYDEIDHLAADPVLDHIPQRRNSSGTSRIFSILDQLKKEDAK
jgi:hypothetical protein